MDPLAEELRSLWLLGCWVHPEEVAVAFFPEAGLKVNLLFCLMVSGVQATCFPSLKLWHGGQGVCRTARGQWVRELCWQGPLRSLSSLFERIIKIKIFY